MTFGSDAEAGSSWVKSEFLFSGVLRRVIDERESFAPLRTIRSASAAKWSSCQCAGRQPSAADTEASLLVVQSLTSLEALRAALQPVCGSSSTGASETVVSTVSNATVVQTSCSATMKGLAVVFAVMRRADCLSCRLQRHLEPRGGLRHHISAVQRLLVSEFWSSCSCSRSRGPLPFRHNSRPGKL